MLARLQVELKAMDGSPLNFYHASLFHGALMEVLDPEYAEILHRNELKPYSQYIRWDKKKCVGFWTIQTLTEEAYKRILLPLKEKPQKTIELKHNRMKYAIVRMEEKTIKKSEFTRRFYSQDSEKSFSIEFLTPTAFKKDGQYLMYPDIHSIYQSLMNKYDATSQRESWKSEEVLDQLVENTRISRYDLKSNWFDVEGRKIPAFLGNITIKLQGPQTMANFVHMMILFGTYSGVGIKAALGMGAIRIYDRKAEWGDGRTGDKAHNRRAVISD